MWLFHWQLNIGAFYLCKQFITDNMHQALKYWYNYTYPAEPIKNPCDMALCWWYKDGLKSLLNFNILMCWVMLFLLWNNISCFAFSFCGVTNAASLGVASSACSSAGHSQEGTAKDTFEFHFSQLFLCCEYSTILILLMPSYPVVVSQVL